MKNQYIEKICRYVEKLVVQRKIMKIQTKNI